MSISASLRPYEEELAIFRSASPRYVETARLDELRASDYSRLDAAGHVYLDYTGGSLYAERQVRLHQQMLLRGVYGNPHSANPASALTTHLVAQCRARVLRYFNASPEEYEAIFTPNASGALKLVGESYPFKHGDRFLLTFDNHNSVNGIREFDRAHGAMTTYIPVTLPELRVDESRLDDYLSLAKPGQNNLFAYPAQSNFSGVQHPLSWIERAHAHGWDVLLDAAAFAPANRLDLSRCKPDYVALSFYKLFGYPTGVGVLIARRDALAKLHRPWFAGGTLEVASVRADRHVLAHSEAAFEDGTPDYLMIPAVEYGLDLLESIGIETIGDRVAALAGWLLETLLRLRHSNGAPMVRLYGPACVHARGGTLTMNFYDANGGVIDHRLVEQRAGALNISLRTGCFCNPGAGEMALGIEKKQIVTCFNKHSSHLTLDDFRMCIDSKSGTGAVRVSLGIVSNFADVYAFARFASEFVRA